MIQHTDTGQHSKLVAFARPGNVPAWDRYADVENNPLRYTDPSGHCVEGAKDYDECMDWVTKIENEWENYNVITCLAGDSVDGRKGWTALEVKLLYKTLSGYFMKVSEWIR